MNFSLLIVAESFSECFSQFGQGLGMELGNTALGDIHDLGHFLHGQLLHIVQGKNELFPMSQFINKFA
jgi:hypothetical protein